MASFLNRERPLLTVILQCRTPETAIGRIRNALHSGAEAFGLQVEALEREYQTPQVIAKLIKQMEDLPVYVTNYRSHCNKGKIDEELAKEMLMIADCGATLCDVMGDIFCEHPDELTDDPEAIEKQLRYIEKLHGKGVEVLMSSHTKKFLPAERVLQIGLEQQRRGADISKIVTKAESMEQQLENMRITHLLYEKLDIPVLHLSGGVSKIHRCIGGQLGNCMSLCVYEHDAISTKLQPLLSNMKQIRELI